MGLFNKNSTNGAVSERQRLETKYAQSRHNILLVVLFSLINIILLVADGSTYFLFSAYVPYLFADLGMLFTGSYPSEVYTGDLAGMEFLPKSFFVVMLVIVMIILVLYLLCWIFSKKQRVGWMITALVFFVIDTAAMLLLNGISADGIIDIVFHGWVVVSLIMGIAAHFKLKKLPAEDVVDAVCATYPEE